jgi:hypothetical protein
MNDWRFLAVGLVWLAIWIVLVVFPRQSQAASRRFEEGKSAIPMPPLVGIPIVMVRFLGCASFAGAALFFYLLFR